MNAYLSIEHPTSSAPILISIPHSGIEIPELIQNRMNLQARRIHTDWHVDLLIKDFPFTKVSTSISRYVVDVNRSKYTSRTSTLPIIPRYDEFGIPLFKQYPSKKFQNEWIANYYSPYYNAIFEQIKLKKQNNANICLLDLHSYDDKHFKTDKIILSTRNGTTISEESFDFIVECFKKEELSIQVDMPFKGGNIVHEISKQANVEAIQIEIPYSLYLHNNKLDSQKAKSLQEKLLQVFLQIEKYYKK
ncbi:N-formylglutamate amidohydrolase [Granulicatella sp.]